MRRRSFCQAATAAPLLSMASSRPSSGKVTDAVTVFAAASLTDVLQAIARRSGRTGPALRFSFAASSTLARQIEQGARADIFIPADEAWLAYLASRQRLAATAPVTVAANRLVIVRRGRPVAGEPPESVEALRRALLPQGGARRIATGDPSHVPVGRYAQTALTRLGLWPEVSGRLVRADNVRSALLFVEHGEAAAGIVYGSDAVGSAEVGVPARFPAASHPPILYRAGLVTGASPAAPSVLAEFVTPEVQALFSAAGFIKP